MDWKQELLNRLDALAAKLGTTATYLWSLLVKQAIIDGITSIVFGSVLCVVIYYGFRLARWKIAAHDTKNTLDPVGVMLYVTSTVACFGAVGLFCDGVNHIVNPGYFALGDVLQRFVQ